MLDRPTWSSIWLMSISWQVTKFSPVKIGSTKKSSFFFLPGTFSHEDLVDGAVNTYIGLHSRKLAATVFSVFNEDTSRQYADRYNPGDITWGPEKFIPLAPPSPIYDGKCQPPPKPKGEANEYTQLTLAELLEGMGRECAFYWQWFAWDSNVEANSILVY